ncbi:MAG: septal ring lytic transglycosylase RlpA family protein [Alphaproteobacteria bacterium]|nr:septal ring lytic transglycosylase RlpA family protein [Alphaproteobacteria bacterium]
MRVLLLFLPFIFLLGGCAETQLVAHVAKQVPGQRSQGDFKVGKPYKVDGKWYTPQESYDYTETGIASWYGPGFQGKKTANGEKFDMNELTAAHRTLQMPSFVRVTNLENGRSVVVRINDRGPFKRSRVIDVSKEAARLLGFQGRGTAKVQLELLAQESRKIAQAAKMGHDTRGTEMAMNEGRFGLQKASYSPGEAPPSLPGHFNDGRYMPDPVVQRGPVRPSEIYVQAGAFGNESNAVRLAQQMQAFGNARVVPATINGQNFYRVRLGPVRDVDAADRLLERVISAGNKEGIIVVD